MYILSLAAVDQVSRPVPAMISNFADDSISVSQIVRAISITRTGMEFEFSDLLS